MDKYSALTVQRKNATETEDRLYLTNYNKTKEMR